MGDLERHRPPGIHALLAARLELLGADERGVLGRAAVSRSSTWAPSRLASPTLEGTTPSLLLELARKELVRPARSDFVGEEAFEFRHLS